MTVILPVLLAIAVPLFSVTSMLAVGFAYTFRELLAPLRNVGGVARVLLANFVFVPLLAVGIIGALSLDLPFAIGLFLVAAGAGAPFLIKLTARADHDVGFSATILVLLLPATVLYLPLVLPWVLPEAAVSAGMIAKPLVLTLLLPLGVGLLVRSISATWANRLLPFAQRMSGIALLMLLTATILLHLRRVLGLFGSGGIVASLLLIIGAFVIGYALGGRNQEIRGILGLATAQRNIAAATIVATQDFEDPRVLIMVVVASLVALAVLFPIASLLRRRLAGSDEASEGNARGTETARFAGR